MRLSVQIIVRNAAENVIRCIRSVKTCGLLRPGDNIYVLDTGSNDGTPEEIRTREPGVTVIERPDLSENDMLERMRTLRPRDFERFADAPEISGGLIKDFAGAREILRTHPAVEGDILFWIDSDDELLGDGEAARKELERIYADGADAVTFLRYDYAFDPAGRCVTQLWRERFVPRSAYRWVGRCHEVLVPTDGHLGRLERLTSVYVSHERRRGGQSQLADLRNYAILYDEMEPLLKAAGTPAFPIVADSVDPRTIFYFANACRGLSEFSTAEWLYREFIPRSGNPEDRILGGLHIAQMAQHQRRFWKAISAYNDARLLAPADPRPIFGAAQCYYDLGLWESVITLGEEGLRLVPGWFTVNTIDPTQVYAAPYYLIAMASMELRDYGRALAAARRLAEADGASGGKEFLEYVEAETQAYGYAQAVSTVISSALTREARVEVLRSIAIPPRCRRHGIARPEGVLLHGERGNVSIYCGRTIEPWGPNSDETGIGGSEGMVIEMAPRLAKRGYGVNVYVELPLGEYPRVRDGVEWRHWAEFNPLLERDIFISWRHPSMAAAAVPVKRKRYVWTHDALPNEAYSERDIAIIDRVMFLSPYQRSLVPRVPEEKVFMTSNGVDAAYLATRKVDRSVNRVIWASSPDRGLYRLLHAWRDLSEAGALPADAELWVYYGFTPTYVRGARERPFVSMPPTIRERHEYMEEVIELVEPLGSVKLLGRKPKRAVLDGFLSAGLLAYPTTFNEIFCMAAAEAQAAGCVVLANRYAALETTVLPENPIAPLESIEPAEVARRLTEYFRAPPPEECRMALAARARELWDLERLADSWVREFER